MLYTASAIRIVCVYIGPRTSAGVDDGRPSSINIVCKCRNDTLRGVLRRYCDRGRLSVVPQSVCNCSAAVHHIHYVACCISRGGRNHAFICSSSGRAVVAPRRLPAGGIGNCYRTVIGIICIGTPLIRAEGIIAEREASPAHAASGVVFRKSSHPHPINTLLRTTNLSANRVIPNLRHRLAAGGFRDAV